MRLRLEHPRNDAVKILDCAAHAHHAVGFELAEVYHRIAIVNVACISEALHGDTVDLHCL